MIRIATVFSGIGAIEHALQRMQIKNEIVFACDNGDVAILTKKIGMNIDEIGNELRELSVIIKNIQFNDEVEDLYKNQLDGMLAEALNELNTIISKTQFDSERKQYQIHYFNEFSRTIEDLKDKGIFLSQIDLENDLYEVIPRTMDRYVSSAGGRLDAVDYLQKAKQNRMVALCEKITKTDSRTIFEDNKFLCIKELVQ